MHARSWAGEDVKRRDAVAATARPASAGVPGVGAGSRSAGRGNARARPNCCCSWAGIPKRWWKRVPPWPNGRATGDCSPALRRGPDGGQTDLAIDVLAGRWRSTPSAGIPAEPYRTARSARAGWTRRKRTARNSCRSIPSTCRAAGGSVSCFSRARRPRRGEFDVIRRLRPPDLPQREEWFLERMKDER